VCRGDASRFWPELFTAVERDWPRLSAAATRRTALDRGEDLFFRTWQALGAGQPAPGLVAGLTDALNDSPDPMALRHVLALAAGLGTGGDTPAERASAAAEHFRQVLAAAPHHVLAGLNRAEALAVVGRRAEAIDQARQTLAVLDRLPRLDPPLLDGGHYPPGLDPFRVEWERAAWSHAGDPAGECRAKRELLHWRLHGLLARETGDVLHRYEAALARPDLPATRTTLGAALLHANRPAEALPHLRRAVAANPFDAAAARELFRLLGELGRPDEQQQLARDRRLLHRAAPRLVPDEPWFQEAPPAADEMTLPPTWKKSARARARAASWCSATTLTAASRRGAIRPWPGPAAVT
jgi:tetratricopeptide (TPR) repeat protein